MVYKAKPPPKYHSQLTPHLFPPYPAPTREKLEEVWFTICDENEIFQDFLNTSESSNDNTNVVNAPQEPLVFNQDPDVDEFPQTLPSFHPTCYSGDENSFTYDFNLNFVDDSPKPHPQPPTYSYEFCGNDDHYGHDYPPQVSYIEELADFINTPNWNRPAFYNNNDEDDDEEYTIAITPGESSVEDLFDSMCDVPFCDNSTPLEASKDHSEILLDSNDDYSSSDDDSLYSEDIYYVEASPPGSELVSLEEVKDFEDGEIDTDILLTIKDNILYEKLLNINLLIAKIKALKDNPTSSFDFVTKSLSTSSNSFLEETSISYNSLPESETFCFTLEEKSSGNPTSYTDLSLPDYEAFFYDTDLVVSFPSGTRNKIFDLGIFIEVQSKRFLSLNEFSISFIRNPLSPVFDTLLPFSSKNEDNVFNPGILAFNEEKSPHLLSHRGFKAFQLIFDFSESPMMIYGEDIPILDVSFLHLYPP
ncbi:hypothetical protein Tco_0013922 [Tanacetum coccineum]